jgi:hypothetical protein
MKSFLDNEFKFAGKSLGNSLHRIGLEFEKELYSNNSIIIFKNGIKLKKIDN